MKPKGATVRLGAKGRLEGFWALGVLVPLIKLKTRRTAGMRTTGPSGPLSKSDRQCSLATLIRPDWKASADGYQPPINSTLSKSTGPKTIRAQFYLIYFSSDIYRPAIRIPMPFARPSILTVPLGDS